MPVWCGGAAGGSEEVSNKYQMGKLQSTGPFSVSPQPTGLSEIFRQSTGPPQIFRQSTGPPQIFRQSTGPPPFWPPQPTGPLEISDSPRDRPKFPTVHGTAKNSDTHRTAQISDSPRDRPKFGAVHGTAPNFRQSTGPAVPERHDPRRRCSMLKHLVDVVVQSRSTIKRTEIQHREHRAVGHWATYQ